MDSEKALELIKWQSNLWPEWKPNDDLRALWIKQLRDYDEDVIRPVVEKYKMSKRGQFKGPRMNEILELVQLIFDISHLLKRYFVWKTLT